MIGLRSLLVLLLQLVGGAAGDVGCGLLRIQTEDLVEVSDRLSISPFTATARGRRRHAKRSGRAGWPRRNLRAPGKAFMYTQTPARP